MSRAREYLTTLANGQISSYTLQRFYYNLEASNIKIKDSPLTGNTIQCSLKIKYTTNITINTRETIFSIFIEFIKRTLIKNISQYQLVSCE